ncbi:MAG: Mu transposase C-terminal domain-containing protein [Planctomycetota bacterium]
MSALAKLQPDDSAPLNWREWIAISEASHRLQLSDRQLRRQCKDQLQGMRFARYGPGPNGERAQWWISRSYDQRLLDGPLGDRARANSRRQTVPKAKRDLADARMRCVEVLRRARRASVTVGQAMPAILADCSQIMGKAVSQRTLFRWDRDESAHGWQGLVDGRGGDQKSQGDPAAWDCFKQLYLVEGGPKVRSCWQQVKARAKQEGWAWCSETGCRRMLRTHIPEAVELMHRDPAAYRNHCEPRIAQDAQGWGAGDRWDGDHTQLDFWCRVASPNSKSGYAIVRPWVTAWLDWRTRRIVGFVLSVSPNSSTILAAFRQAMLDPVNKGGPEVVFIDNGKDYDAWVFDGRTKRERLRQKHLRRGYVAEGEFQGLYRELNIRPHFTLPYSPTSKSRVERFFNTLHDRFDRRFKTYAGRSPDTRPESIAQTLKDPRNIPSFEEVEHRLTQQIAHYNAEPDRRVDDLVCPDGGGRLSPDQAMAQLRTHTRIYDQSALDLFLHQWQRPVNVGKDGVRLSIAGGSIYYGGYEPALMPFKGRSKDRPRVMVYYDPADLRRVRVFTADLKFLCEAPMNIRPNAPGVVTEEALRQVMADKRRYRNSMKFINSRQDLDWMLDADLAVAMGRKPTPPIGPDELPDPTPAEKTFRPMSTRLDDQVEPIERESMRLAAGAEDLSDPDEDYGDILASLADSPSAGAGDADLDDYRLGDELGDDDGPEGTGSDHEEHVLGRIG